MASVTDLEDGQNFCGFNTSKEWTSYRRIHPGPTFNIVWRISKFQVAQRWRNRAEICRTLQAVCVDWMGSSVTRCRRIVSKDTPNNGKMKSLHSLLPTNERITIRLVPKFFISEGNAKEKSYYIVVHLQDKVRESDSVDELSGSVEFFTRTVLLKKRPGLTSVLCYGRRKDVKTHSVKASNVKVLLARGKSLCISGTFQRTLECLGRDQRNCSHFTLIFKRRRQDEGTERTWLEGTLSTTNSNSRYSCYWKAVTRDVYDRSLSDNVYRVPTIVVTAPS